MTALLAAMAAAATVDMRVIEATDAGLCDVQCRACGWRTHGGHIRLAKIAEGPFPCMRCHQGDWRPIGDIAAEIAARVQGGKHG